MSLDMTKLSNQLPHQRSPRWGLRGQPGDPLVTGRWPNYATLRRAYTADADRLWAQRRAGVPVCLADEHHRPDGSA